MTIQKTLTRDHERLDALLGRAIGPDGTVDLDVFDAFRRALLRHIGIEERILFPALRESGGWTEVEQQLHRDHAALAALLVPPPSRAEVENIRAVLTEHNPLEEGDSGFYARIESLPAETLATLNERVQAYPEVKTAPYNESEILRRSLEQLLRQAAEGRRLLRER